MLQGSLHAAEHGQIAVLPLLAMCDRWDIGSLSTAFHHQTGRATIFIPDEHPGGVGIARAGFERFKALVDDALRLISECPCRSGCPSCVQSPKCSGSLNRPLNKRGAIELLSRMAAGGWCTQPVCARQPALKHRTGSRSCRPMRARRIAPLFLAAVVAAWPPAAALAGDGGGRPHPIVPSGVERNGGAPTTRASGAPE